MAKENIISQPVSTEIEKERHTAKKNRIKEMSIKGVFLAAAVFSILAVLSIFLFLFAQGIPALSKIGVFKFIFGSEWNPSSNDTFDNPLQGSYGIFPMIIGSTYAIVGAMVIGGVLGFLLAIFLSMFCPQRLKRPLTQIVNLLAGIPSIVYGVFGMQVILPIVGKLSPYGNGSGVLSVSIVLGIMILPTVTALSKAGIDAVDKSIHEEAVGLGCSYERATFKVVVPAAKSSVLASIILGIGRALGETMAVVMIQGGQPVFPSSLVSSFRTLTANIVMEMSYAQDFHKGALIATGCVLFVLMLIINLSFAYITRDKKVKKGPKGKVKHLHLAPEVYNIAYSVSVTEQNSIAVDSSGTAVIDNSKDSFAKVFRRVAGKVWGEVCAFFIRIYNVIHKFYTKHIHRIVKYASYTATVISFIALVSIIGFVFVKGLPHISLNLLFGKFTYSGAPTILPSIVSTIMMVGLTSLIAFPLGIATAIYLCEYARKESRLVKVIRTAVEILGGIPSIIYGLFGVILFCSFMNLGTSILAGSLTMTIMTLPTTVRATEEALKSVPQSYREASLALGCGKFRTIFKVILPAGIPGILAAVILGIGKMLGESAPLLFTMGAGLKPMPRGLLAPGASLAVAMYALAREGLYVNEAFATGCILIILVLGLNLTSTYLVSRIEKKMKGK